MLVDPFGLDPMELIAVDVRGRESRLKTVGLRLDMGRGAGIHVGLHKGRIHVMARGAVQRRRRVGSRVVKSTVGYLQLVMVREPMGLAFEVRPMGEFGRRLLSDSSKVSVLDKNGRARVVKERRFEFAPAPGAEVSIEVAGTARRPKLILDFVNEVNPSPPGEWRTRIGVLLHASVNSTHVLFRKMRMATLPS
jgi:hypothetical protein